MSGGEVALLPCPFCGGGVTIADNTGPKICSAPHAFVQCFTCHTDGPEAATVEVAIAAWNTRTAPTPPVAASEVVREAEDCGAVSDDAIAHLRIRSQLNRTIYAAVRRHNMTNMTDADDHWSPYPLVDLMSNPAPSDISTGEMEMVALVDEIEEAVRRLATPTATHNAEALRDAVIGRDDTSVEDRLSKLVKDQQMRLSKQDAFDLPIADETLRKAALAVVTDAEEYGSLESRGVTLSVRTQLLQALRSAIEVTK